MAPRKARVSRATSVYPTHTESCYGFYCPNSAQSTLKDAQWLEEASKDELHTELLKIENENADLQRQVKTYLKELTVANDKITARDAEIAELKSTIATLKIAPGTNLTHACALNEKMFNQVCDGVESQLAVYRQRFEILRVKYKALEHYKDAMEAKNANKGKNSRQPRKGKAAMEDGEVPEATVSLQDVDAMELNDDHEVQQANEPEQSSTSPEEY